MPLWKRAAALLLAGLAATAASAAYPDKPIRLVIGFPAGGPLDQHARLLADRLGVDPATVETNMVFVDGVEAAMVAAAARAQGVLVGQVSSHRIRMVTHLDVDRAGVERAAKVVAEVLAR